MMVRHGDGNERTKRNDRIAFGNVAREQRGFVRFGDGLTTSDRYVYGVHLYRLFE